MANIVIVKGGKGSGNFGHSGIIGHVGGSIPKGTSSHPADTQRQYIESLTEDQRYAIRRYTGGEFNSMNAHLREGKKVNDNVAKRIKILDNTLRDAPKLKDAIEVTRVIWGSPEEMGMKAGQIYQDKGFLSTSIKGRQEAIKLITGIRAWIKLPKGSSGLWVGDKNVSGHPVEKEFLLPPGQKLKVNSIKADSDKSWTVEMELIND